jgi:putative transposase
MRKSRFTEEQIAMALRQAEAGTTVEEICRKLGVSSATFFRWKKVYGGLGVPELRELRQLREENRRLKGLVADLTLDKNMLQEALQKDGDPCAAPGTGCGGHLGVPGSRAQVLFRVRGVPQHVALQEPHAQPGALATAPARAGCGTGARR